eukprot:scaffold264116_cov30-Tisochrysis_lutea.AAC.1
MRIRIWMQMFRPPLLACKASSSTCRQLCQGTGTDESAACQRTLMGADHLVFNVGRPHLCLSDKLLTAPVKHDTLPAMYQQCPTGPQLNRGGANPAFGHVIDTWVGSNATAGRAFGRKAQNYETINYAFCACISMAHGTLNMALEKRKTMRSAPPWRMALYF